MYCDASSTTLIRGHMREWRAGETRPGSLGPLFTADGGTGDGDREEEICSRYCAATKGKSFDQVLEHLRTGLDRSGIVGVAAKMGLPPEHNFSGPLSL